MHTLLKLYKYSFSWMLRFLTGTGCRFTPTCSEYAVEAITKYGAIKGTLLAVRRVLRCHPGSPAGYDPLP